VYNPETIAQAEDWLQVFVLREAGIAERSGYRVPPEPLDYLIRWAYERQQVSKRLPNDHPMRVPDDVFWTDERQELANDIAYAAVEDMTAADWWADQTPEQQRQLVLEEERQQEEERGNGGHN
jgi:hypothetical protein